MESLERKTKRMEKFKVQVINRHRMKTDGNGITTLVALYGCPLNCKYCLNKKVLSIDKYKEITPEELVQLVMIDYCYFKATGGGITFGGGEPLIYSKQIAKTRSILPSDIKINVETSLNVDTQNLLDIVDFVDEIIIDIKSLNTDIYRRYTDRDNTKLVDNLNIIAEKEYQHKCLIRIPNIPEYTTKEDIDNSIRLIKQLGFTNIDTFDYVIRGAENNG